jgi:hypothetical protein
MEYNTLRNNRILFFALDLMFWYSSTEYCVTQELNLRVIHYGKVVLVHFLYQAREVSLSRPAQLLLG